MNWLASDGFNHVIGLQIWFGLPAGTAGAEGGHEHAGATGELHFLGGQKRDVLGGQSPRLKFRLAKNGRLPRRGANFEGHFPAGAQHNGSDFLADRDSDHQQIEDRQFFVEPDADFLIVEPHQNIIGLEAGPLRW